MFWSIEMNTFQHNENSYPFNRKYQSFFFLMTNQWDQTACDIFYNSAIIVLGFWEGDKNRCQNHEVIAQGQAATRKIYVL